MLVIPMGKRQCSSLIFYLICLSCDQDCVLRLTLLVDFEVVLSASLVPEKKHFFNYFRSVLTGNGTNSHSC